MFPPAKNIAPPESQPKIATAGAPDKSKNLRILVTDDSPMYRRIISEVFSRYPDVEVVGTSFDGEDCLELAASLEPNVITLDINMPRRDGLSTLEELRKRGCRAYIVMVSTPTSQSADQTLHALRKGALDLILKPMGSNLAANRKLLEDQLAKQVDTIRCLVQSAKSRLARNSAIQPSNITGGNITGPNISGPNPIAPGINAPNVQRTQPDHRTESSARTIAPSGNQFNIARPLGAIGAYDVLCIGVSTGGPSALGTILPQIPARINVPIFIVQHMPPLFTKSLADHLDKQCKFHVCEASDGLVVEPGVAYIAPGGKQMRIKKRGTQTFIEITDDPFVAAAKPSVDYLFDSIADVYGKKTLAMILTGMGSDGLNGCRKLYSKGAKILAQSEDSCVVYGMPRQVIEHQVSSEVIHLHSMAARVIEMMRL